MKFFTTITRHLCFLTLFLFTLNNLSAQVVFSASDDESDYFIDVNWLLPVDPCLVDANGDLHSEVTTRILRDGEEIDFQQYDSQALQDLLTGSLPPPNVSYYSNHFFISPSFRADSMIQDVEDYTIEFWVNITNRSEGMCFLQFSNFEGFCTQGDVLISSGGNLTYDFQNRSYHVAFVADQTSNKTEVFINGSSIGETNTYKSLSGLTDMALDDGVVSDIKIWDIKRTPFQIAQNLGFNGPNNENHLVVYAKMEHNSIIDVATDYDGAVQNLSANTFLAPYVYTPASTAFPLLGTIRDFVGKNKTHNYEINVYAGPYGQIDHDCTRSDNGTTGEVRAPEDLSISTDLLDRINVSWNNASDLATAFKLYRIEGMDSTLVHSITNGVERDSVYAFRDIFEEDGFSSIQSGKAYPYKLVMESSLLNEFFTYTLGQGNTLDINFSASISDSLKVDLSWDNTAANLIDGYRLIREGNLAAVKSTSEVDHIDDSPYFGDSTLYEIALIKADTVRAKFPDQGFAKANGLINGRVITEQGLFPVEAVSVKMTRLSSGEIDSVITDETGFFEFDPVAYGLLDSFELSATKTEHEFTYPVKKMSLSANQRLVENAQILSDFDFGNGQYDNEVISFTATGNITQDHVVLNWVLSSNAPENVFVDVIRNGEIIFNQQVAMGGNLDSIYIDEGGTPNEETKYEIRIYDINGAQLSSAVQDTTLIFPSVSSIPFLTVTSTNQGYVSGVYNVTSTNVDGYRVYRNDSLILTLPPGIGTQGFIDSTAAFNVDYTYSMTSIRILNEVTYETSIPTVSIVDPVNLGAMPVPSSITVITQSAPFNLLLFYPPAGINPNFKFTGYRIYRNGEFLGKINKSNNPLAEIDYTGWGQQNIVYEISLYRALENGFIESERIGASPTSFPSIDRYPTQFNNNELVLEENINEGFIRVKWTDNVLYNVDGYVLSYNGQEVVRLGNSARNYTHFPTGNNHEYSLRYYKTYQGQDYFSDAITNTSNTAFGNDPQAQMVDPENVSVSRDLPNQVHISWEYLDFIDADFEIYKLGNLIATLPVGSRSYYDHLAENNVNDNNFERDDIGYQVRAILGSAYSDKIGASGDVVTAKMIYGFVLDLNTGLGISNSAIELINNTNNLNVIRHVVKTDSAGYYSFILPQDLLNGINGSDLQIKAVVGSAFTNEETISIDQQSRYRQDLVFNLPEEFPNVNDATIEFIDVDINPYDLKGNIHWQATNDNYDGIELRRGLDVIALMDKSEGNLFVDTSAAPGILQTYQIRTFKNTSAGRIFSAFDLDQTLEVQYPPVAPVILPTATALLEENAIKIEWSHLYNHADGYVISRNGVFKHDVDRDEVFKFIDSTGTAGEEYMYTLTAYKVVNGFVYRSTDVNVSIIYPSAAEIKNLELEIPFTANQVIGGDQGTIAQYHLNAVEISWEYEANSVNGFKVYRDDVLIATLPADSTSYLDGAGTPEATHNYSVSALVMQNGVVNESDKVDAQIQFPAIQMPSDFVATPRPNIGDRVFTWNYPTPDFIDGFVISISESADVYQDTIPADAITTYVENLTHSTFTVNTFELKAYSIRQGQFYTSPRLEFDYETQKLPLATCTASQGTLDGMVQISWDYPVEAKFDGFYLYRENVDLSITLIATLSVSERSFLDENVDYDETYEYFILPFRDGDIFFSECSSQGYPNPNLPPIYTTAGLTYDNVAIDGQWKMIGSGAYNLDLGKVDFYKFENNDWVLHQTIISSQLQGFGRAVAISGNTAVIGAPFDDEFRGKIYICEFNETNDSWEVVHNEVSTEPRNRFGSDVSIDGDLVVVGSHKSSILGVGSIDEVINVYRRLGNSFTKINHNGGAIELPGVMDHQVSVAVDGNTIVVGMHGWRVNNLWNGRIWVAQINGDEYTIDQILNGSDEERFGHDVTMVDEFTIITSSTSGRLNGVKTGKAYSIKLEANGLWEIDQTFYSNNPVLSGNFGSDVKSSENGIFIVNERNPVNGKNIFVYQKNATTDQFELIQSPDPNDTKYRWQLSPAVSSTQGFLDIDVDDHFITHTGNGREWSFKLFELKINNLIATDGSLTTTRLTWDLDGCTHCPDNYIDSYRIFRDEELIATVDGDVQTFFDEELALIDGASVATVGKEYVYQVEAKVNADFDLFSERDTDVGFSKRQGKFSGQILVSGTTTPVPGVSIELFGIDSAANRPYSYSTITDLQGNYTFNEVYVGTGISYTATPSYLDHVFSPANTDTYILDLNEPTETNVLFFDNTAYAVTGRVTSAGSDCGLKDIKVKYFQTINGQSLLADSVRTASDGSYSIIVKPFLDNLSEIVISVEDLQDTVDPEDSTLVQYQFSSETAFTDFIDFPVVSEVNFVDELTYEVPLQVINTCGSPIADQQIEIRVGSLDGCYEYTVETDADGMATLNLNPKNYIIVVNDILGSGVTNYENAGADYLKLRPIYLDLISKHIEAGANTLPTIEPQQLIYHRAVEITYSSSFERFLDCGGTDSPAIIAQGERHFMSFNLSENHRAGESCAVNEGFVVITNSAAVDLKDTLFYNSNTRLFPAYQFTAGSPNLVPPHALAISLQYFSDQGSLLGDLIIPIYVEGSSPLPGTGVQTDPVGGSGGIQMPLFVLRDPPGDRSFSSIQTGTTISKTLSIKEASKGSAGLFIEGAIAVFNFGVFGNIQSGAGQSNSNQTNYSFNYTTTDTYKTSNSPDAVGRGANVIVGAGVSSLFGLTQELKFENDCEPKSSTVFATGLGGFESTYSYTIDFIEQLIAGYKRDSILIEQDLLSFIGQDGTLFTKEEARIEMASNIAQWQEMLHYHDVETVPHYVLCNDFSYRDQMSPEAISQYDGWKNGFCNQIGFYQGDEFTMDESIEWDASLIASYNNAIAFCDTIKGTFLDNQGSINADLNLSNHEITQNGLAVTNAFHNSLGLAAKTAEVFDISGNVTFSRSFQTKQSSSTKKDFTRFFYMNSAFGPYINFGVSTEFLVVSAVNSTVQQKIGTQIKSEASINVNKSEARSNSSTISYTILDDDAEDQVAFIALQAPLQNQTPYFIRLGGFSSCPPEEALTLNQDNDPILIDDPTISVVIDPISGAATPNPPPVYYVEDGDAAIFQVKIGNLGPLGISRSTEVFLDLASNPNGAIIKLGGSNLNLVSPVLSIPPGGSLDQTLTVERPNGTPFYDFEGLRIGVKPACGGESKYINLDVYFKSPCSPVSITKPFDGLVVNRINPFIANDREVIPFEIRDYQSNNLNLEFIQLEYKRLGSGVDFKPVPGGIINRLELATNDAGLALGQDPLYFFEWDITGEYNLYPDGEYKVRARAFCGLSGNQYSNESQITLSRSDLLLTGYPQPADGIWVDGDEISATFSTDIDCGFYNVIDSNIHDYLTLVDMNTMMEVPFTISCQNNKLILIPDNPMSDYDGHTLRSTFKNIKNLIGTIADEVIWDFRVVTSEADWQDEIVEITMYENTIETISTSIFNTTPNGVTNLQLAGTQTWLTTNPAIGSLFNIPTNGIDIDLTFNTNGRTKGIYTSTMTLQGTSANVAPIINIKLIVIQALPEPTINPIYTDSMKLVLNWSFLDPYKTSTDVNDVIQVYKDGQYRGQGQIQEQGSFYYANIWVYGNASDTSGLLDFVIWNSDESKAYVPIQTTVIPFDANTTRGVLTNPEILLVDDDTFQFRGRIYVDSSNVNAAIYDGLSWETAFLTLEEGIAAANSSDTIWVAEGTYFPSFGDRNESYEIDKSIAIVAGFQNGMTEASQRTGQNETIISGEIGLAVSTDDNTYHVMKNSGLDVLIDMVTFSSGNANGTGDEAKGGNLYNTGSLTLKDCKMRLGGATGKGALIYNTGEITINGGEYFVPAASAISNVHNEAGATLTIQQNVSIKRE